MGCDFDSCFDAYFLKDSYETGILIADDERSDHGFLVENVLSAMRGVHTEWDFFYQVGAWKLENESDIEKQTLIDLIVPSFRRDPCALDDLNHRLLHSLNRTRYPRHIWTLTCLFSSSYPLSSCFSSSFSFPYSSSFSLSCCLCSSFPRATRHSPLSAPFASTSGGYWAQSPRFLFASVRLSQTPTPQTPRAFHPNGVWGQW